MISLEAKILVADDGRMERQFLGRLFERMGADVRFAESGAECIEIAAAEKFDIMFIDHLMPEMDGIQVLKEIRKNKEGPNAEVPAVALGTPEVEGDDEFFLGEGFINYLDKPVEYKMLRAALVLYLPESAGGGLLMAEEEEQGLPQELQWIADVEEITYEDGIKNCGSEEAYLSALHIFYDSIDDKADEIMRFYDEEDWNDYTIKVHALKSSARIIGASALSEMALEMENAGNDEDIDLIRAKTDELIRVFRSFKDKLSPLGGGNEDEDEQDKPPAEKDFLEDAYLSLVEFADQMDFDLVEMVLNSVKEYSLSKEDKEHFAEIEKKFADLDWHGLAAAARKGLS